MNVHGIIDEFVTRVDPFGIIFLRVESTPWVEALEANCRSVSPPPSAPSSRATCSHRLVLAASLSSLIRVVTRTMS